MIDPQTWQASALPTQPSALNSPPATAQHAPRLTPRRLPRRRPPHNHTVAPLSSVDSLTASRTLWCRRRRDVSLYTPCCFPPLISTFSLLAVRRAAISGALTTDGQARARFICLRRSPPRCVCCVCCAVYKSFIKEDASCEKKEEGSIRYSRELRADRRRCARVHPSHALAHRML